MKTNFVIQKSKNLKTDTNEKIVQIFFCNGMELFENIVLKNLMLFEILIECRL